MGRSKLMWTLPTPPNRSSTSFSLTVTTPDSKSWCNFSRKRRAHLAVNLSSESPTQTRLKEISSARSHARQLSPLAAFTRRGPRARTVVSVIKALDDATALTDTLALLAITSIHTSNFAIVYSVLFRSNLWELL